MSKWKYITFDSIQFWQAVVSLNWSLLLFPQTVFPKSYKWPAPFGRLSKEWTAMIRNEYNTMSMNIQWQWFIFDQVQCRHAAMPVYSGLVIIDCPRWLPHFPGPHLADSRRSEPQLSVTSWMCVCGVTMATMPTQICERWCQLQHIRFWLTQLIWQKTLELIEIKLQ